MEQYGHEGDNKENIIEVSNPSHWTMIYRLMGEAVGVNHMLEGLYATLKDLNLVSFQMLKDLSKRVTVPSLPFQT